MAASSRVRRRIIPTTAFALALLLLTPATLAAPPGEAKGPASRSSAMQPAQKIVIREAALASLLRDASASANSERERMLADLTAKLQAQKDAKSALLSRLAPLMSQVEAIRIQAAEFRRQAAERRASFNIPLLRDLDKVSKELDQKAKEKDAEAAAFDPQIANLKTQLQATDVEIKRLLIEIQNLQRDEDEERAKATDDRLADIERQLQRAVEQLRAPLAELQNALGTPLPPEQRNAAETRALEELKRIKNIREGIAIGRASKRPKVSPMGSSRSSG